MFRALIFTGIATVMATTHPHGLRADNVNIPNVPTTTTTTPTVVTTMPTTTTPTTTTTTTVPTGPVIDYAAVGHLVNVDRAAMNGDRAAAEQLVRFVFNEEPARAVAIARRESGLRCDARNPHSSASGLMQLMSVHNRRASSLGVTWLQVQTSCLANLVVAHALYAEQGWRPWRL